MAAPPASSHQPLDALAERFTRFADRECHGISSLYERLARGIAADPDLLALTASARPGQPVPNLFLATVHLLLLKGAQHPLAAFYPSVSDGRQDGDPVPVFRDFCRRYADEIAEPLATRIVQTNEVRRSACLLPAFGRVAKRAGGRSLALVELGASAGLNLLFDRYQYNYADGRQYGDRDSPVLIECGTRGDRWPPLPKAPPAVATRVGIDLNPIDPRDPETALWLQALVWPEHRARAELLRRALEVARAEPLTLLAGDALELLPQALEEAPAEAALCVFHTFTVNQFSPEQRQRLVDLLEVQAARRDLYRVSFEWLGRERPLLELTCFEGGQQTEQLLATCDPHGAWIEWLADGD